jgi:hypothetical protein
MVSGNLRPNVSLDIVITVAQWRNALSTVSGNHMLYAVVYHFLDLF